MHVNKKTYLFLSSSPPPTDGLIQDAEDSESVSENVGMQQAVTKVPQTYRPAKTMHVTSVAQLNAANGARKTLGVRRSMNGWSDRMNRGFSTPLMKQPP